MTRKAITLSMVFLAICSIQIACKRQEEPQMRKLNGPSDRVELVFFFKKNVSDSEIYNYVMAEFNLENPDGKGYRSINGVSGNFLVTQGKYKGYAIEFFPSATQEQREKIKNKLKNSTLVHKIYENVIPNEIKDLER